MGNIGIGFGRKLYGMLRRRPIPWQLLEPDAWPPERRQRLAVSWRQRASSEHAAGLVFQQLAADLVEVEAPPAIIEGVRTAIRDEVRHAERCARVAEVLGAPAVEMPASVPMDRRLPARERVAAIMVGTMCVSESVSTAMLAAFRDETTHPTLHAIETELCAEESTHARLGFAWLRTTWMTLPMSTRLMVENGLPRTFHRLEVPRRGRWRELYRRTISDRVVPELERSGVKARRAWERRLP